ncbi:MAG: hypothetical protein EHM24_26825 [Acidobacteria bacterium]|nr:MAG: hypothetical protein EHM24_26825 [Acidobacteriota bacterium]
MADYASPFSYEQLAAAGTGARLVGVLGRARSGKDTYAQRLVDTYGYTRVAFADPLKAVAYATDPTVYADGAPHRLAALVDTVGWEAAKEHAEVRRLLQHLGTAMRDHVDPDIWLTKALRTARQTAGSVVITDVRFPNEAEAIKARCGTLVRIVREEPDPAAHLSERLLDDYPTDLTIYNTGDLARFHRFIDATFPLL